MNTDVRIDEFALLFGEKRVRGTLKKMTDIEISHCRLDRAREALVPFEKRFRMKSEEAWEKYQQGELEDDIEIMEWMGLYENFFAVADQLQRIKNSRAYAELLSSAN